MASKVVVDKQKSAESVIAAGETHASATQEALLVILKPHLKKGEVMPDFAAVMRLSCAALEAAKNVMIEKDAEHEAELSDDPEVRARRDAAAAATSEELVSLREVLTGLYGGAIAGKVLPGSTPQDATMLARFAGEAAANLKKAKFPAARVKGAKVDVAELTESLESKSATLTTELKAVQREVREAEATLTAKNEAILAYDEVFMAVANGLQGILKLAGKNDLAARVRPSLRRPGQTADDAGEAPPPAEKTPTEKTPT